MKKTMKFFFVALASLLIFAACGPDETGNSHIKGKVVINGSSTVSPVTQAVVEEYSKEYRQVEITIGISGTGGGFKKFVSGETDVQNASRKIKEKELEDAKKNGVEFYELEIGKDAIVFAVNKKNTWVKNLTSEQLKEIWSEGSKIKTWKDIDPSWPDEKIQLYAPASDSGTYDYFHTEILGSDVAMRNDYTASQDMNVLVTGVQGDKNALGFFGYVYYKEMQDEITAVAVNDVFPTNEAIQAETYEPLSRGLYIYVNKEHYAKKEELQTFVQFYMDNAAVLTEETGYPPLSDEQYEVQKDKLK